MSWSVSVKGKPGELKGELERQFSYSIADPPAGLADDGERETVKLVAGMISQCLGTFDPEKVVSVTANGHMGFDQWGTKAGAVQTVHIAIEPS